MSEPVTVIYWRDIPAQVVSGQGRKASRMMLPDRFQEAIDRAATRAGLIGSDEYMAEWRKVQVEDDVVEEVAARLEAEYPNGVLDALIRNYGAGS
jgi:hypothetical protein